jgi:hypothetical protein
MFPLYRITFRSGAKKHLSDMECTISEAEQNNIRYCGNVALKGNGNIFFYFLIWKNFWNYFMTSFTDSSYLA